MQSMQKEFMLYVIDFKFHFLKWMRNLCKRGYENVVGLSFVRDLYGMVMNEGTTKGDISYNDNDKQIESYLSPEF